jgi:hypothetical protein
LAAQPRVSRWLIGGISRHGGLNQAHILGAGSPLRSVLHSRAPPGFAAQRRSDTGPSHERRTDLRCEPHEVPEMIGRAIGLERLGTIPLPAERNPMRRGYGGLASMAE